MAENLFIGKFNGSNISTEIGDNVTSKEIIHLLTTYSSVFKIDSNIYHADKNTGDNWTKLKTQLTPVPSKNDTPPIHPINDRVNLPPHGYINLSGMKQHRNLLDENDVILQGFFKKLNWYPGVTKGGGNSLGDICNLNFNGKDGRAKIGIYKGIIDNFSELRLGFYILNGKKLLESNSYLTDRIEQYCSDDLQKCIENHIKHQTPILDTIYDEDITPPNSKWYLIPEDPNRH